MNQTTGTQGDGGSSGTESAQGASEPAPAIALPVVRTGLDQEAVLQRLGTLSKRGKLAGFAKGSGGVLFSAAAFGKYFDYALDARAKSGGGGPTELEFEMRMERRMPLIFAVVLVLTVWPGCWLTKNILTMYLAETWALPIATWTYWWYLPLTVLPIPWMWRKVMRESRAAAEASAREVVQKIAKELERPASAG